MLKLEIYEKRDNSCHPLSQWFVPRHGRQHK